LIGVFIILAWGTADAAARWRIPRGLTVAGWSLALSALAILTVIQTRLWRDDMTLFRHALYVTKDNFLAHAALGSAFRDQGRYEEAAGEFSECVRIGPYFPLYHYVLGDTLEHLGRHELALERFRRMLELNPGNGLAELRIANLLSDMGRREEAVPYYRKVIGKNLNTFLPKWELAQRAGQAGALEARINLGFTLREMGRLEESRFWLADAVALFPRSWKARTSLGTTLSQLGRHEEAVSMIRSALPMDAAQPLIPYHLGLAQERAGQFEDAALSFREALRRDPGYKAAQDRLEALAIRSVQAPGPR
jgi:tetratricopeptide (TPR) repeat protein